MKQICRVLIYRTRYEGAPPHTGLSMGVCWLEDGFIYDHEGD